MDQGTPAIQAIRGLVLEPIRGLVLGPGLF